MKNILVTAASGIIGYGILKSLRMSKTPYKLIGTTIYEDSIALGFCDIFVKAPMTSDDGYIDWLLKTVREYKVDLLIPGFDTDVQVWNEHIIELERSGVKVVLNKSDLISLCLDKWEFYKVLKKNNNPYAIPSTLCSEFDELPHDFNLPLLLKPKKGSASKGIVKVLDKETFESYKEKIGTELLVQPLIGNDEEEYTTSAFCDGNGGFYSIMTMRRKLSKQGFTEKAEVFESEEIKKAVLSLCKIFKPLGPTNFQFRIENDVCQLLEINPRISSATSIRSLFGYNESVMAAEYYLDNKPPRQPKIKKGRAVRYVEDFIFSA